MIPFDRIARTAIVWCLMASCMGFTGTRTAAAQGADDASPKNPSAIRFAWDDHPMFWIGGDTVEIQVRGRFHTVGRTTIGDGSGDLVARKGRVGIQGTLFKRVEYEISHEFGAADPWRDVYVIVPIVGRLQVQAGQFKMPFSREQLTSSSEIDFINRSLLASTLAPGRDTGVMFEGRVDGRTFTYAAGAFSHDGKNVKTDGDSLFFSRDGSAPESQRSLAVRVTTAPLKRSPKSLHLRSLDVGFSGTSSDVPEGLNSLRGRSVFEDTFFPRVYVRGRRLRLGSDVDWRSGPFSVGGELARVREQRLGQGLRDEDLPELESTAWTASAAWVLTGENNSAGGVVPRRPLPRHGIGAVELAVRLEELGFRSRTTDGQAFRNPRAAHVLGNRDRVWTVGANWFLNRWLIVRVNALHEAFDDAERSPAGARLSAWSSAWQLYLEF